MDVPMLRGRETADRLQRSIWAGGVQWGSNPQPRDHEVAAFGRSGPVTSDWSGGIGERRGMKRGIFLTL